jgi:hypothetical protein
MVQIISSDVIVLYPHSATAFETRRVIGCTVHILARRLETTVTVEQSGTTTFTLTFPLHAELPVEPRMTSQE